MTAVVLGLDQGTSSTRCLALDRGLSERGAAAVRVGASFPAPGLVEQDPAELVHSARAAIRGALDAAGADAGDVVAVGIANQTETFLVADRGSARPVYPAIVWQDRRTADRCAALAAEGHAERVAARTGLELDATFPATKVGWVLDRVGGARAAAEAGELVYHDVAGWLLRHLIGAEACEVGNAGRTLLCPLGGLHWDDELLSLFDVPRRLMPAIVDSDAVARAGFDGGGVPSPAAGGRSGSRSPGPAGGGVASPAEAALPVAAVLGDQQASLFGLGCRHAGSAKVTLGTGAFILAQAGASAPSPPRGVLASCAWRRDGEPSFALEGFVPAAGAALDWFTGIGVLPPAAELDGLIAGPGGDDGSVVCVSALQGLGTPAWDAGVRGMLLGLTRATGRAELARAVVDGVLHQVADALAAISTAMPLATVLLDGGLSRSRWVVQRLADLAGVRVERAARGEATALGAAMMAGLAAGFWAGEDELPPVAVDVVAEPALSDDQRVGLRQRWAAALALAREWRG